MPWTSVSYGASFKRLTGPRAYGRLDVRRFSCCIFCVFSCSVVPPASSFRVAVLGSFC